MADRTHRSGRVAVALAMLWTVAACGSDAEDEGARQAPGVGTVALGEFDDLPAHPRSEPIGPRSEKDGVVTQSFSATGASPEQVLRFYVEQLQELGWRSVEPVHRQDTATRADFVRRDTRLEVTVTSLVVRAGPEEATVQYSLTLRP